MLADFKSLVDAGTDPGVLGRGDRAWWIAGHVARPPSNVKMEARMEHVESLLKATLAEIERLLSTRTVVGEPINIEGQTIIPLIAVGFAFGGGGGSGKDQKRTSVEGLGAGSGGGGGVKPVAVIIVNKDGVHLESVRRGAATMVEKVGEAVGKIMEKRGEKSA
ncbi:MAG TPA: spore germination protein GerW family protein [Vicinamibacterales bacterium]